MVGKWTERDCEVIQIIVGCFCFAENRGMLPSSELLVNDLDVIVIVVNRRLLYLWRISVFIVIFSVLWWNKTDKCIDLWLFSSVVVLLLLYSTNGSCWWIMHVTDIVVSWKLGSNCIVYIETGWCCGFRVNSLKFICTVCLVVFKHIRSGCNKFRKCWNVARSKG